MRQKPSKIGKFADDKISVGRVCFRLGPTTYILDCREYTHFKRPQYTVGTDSCYRGYVYLYSRPRERLHTTMVDNAWSKAVMARQTALDLSPATLEELESDVVKTGGLAYSYLSSKAEDILSSRRGANPLCHDGMWAFDIDGFVYVTNVPHSGKSYAEARSLLDALLARAQAMSKCSPIPSSHRASVAKPLKSMSVSPGEKSLSASQTAGQILSSMHYTLLPRWILDGSLGLTIAERIVLSEILDVVGSGRVLSYEASMERIFNRTGLKRSTAGNALSGLVSHGILTHVEGVRGRYSVSWGTLSSFVAGTDCGKDIAMALTAADLRRRLTDKKHSLALPSWAVVLCGATEAALLLAKAWAVLHGKGDGIVWASGQTLSSWLPGSERALRRARASLSSIGLVSMAAQYSTFRQYRHMYAKNRTAEFRADADGILRALVVRGFDFGADLSPAVRSLFAGQPDVARDAAAYDSSQMARNKIKALRRRISRFAIAFGSEYLQLRKLLEFGATSRVAAPWRNTSPKALLSSI